MCWPGTGKVGLCFSLGKVKTLSLGLNAQTSSFCEISQVVWVSLGGKTNNQFGFLCVEGIVCPGLYFLSICSCVFVQQSLVSAQDYLFAILNVTFFRRLGFPWACVCSAPSKVQFSVYYHCRCSVWNVEVVTDTVLLLCLRNMKTCSNK